MSLFCWWAFSVNKRAQNWIFLRGFLGHLSSLSQAEWDQPLRVVHTSQVSQAKWAKKWRSVARYAPFLPRPAKSQQFNFQRSTKASIICDRFLPWALQLLFWEEKKSDCFISNRIFSRFSRNFIATPSTNGRNSSRLSMRKKSLGEIVLPISSLNFQWCRRR